MVTASGGPAPAVGVWTHLTGIYDPGAVGAAQLRLYVNGNLVASAALGGLWSATGGVRVGGDLQAGANTVPLQGSVDGVRVWDRVLTDEEVAVTATEAVLLGRWSFDEGTGSTAADASGHGKTVTFTNATWADRPPGYAFASTGPTSSAATNGPVLRTDTSYTISAWAQVINPAGYAAIAGQDGATSSGFFLQYKLDTNQWSFAVPATDTTNPTMVRISSPAPAVDPDAAGDWVFLTAVYDAPHHQLRLYVNGVTEGDGGPTVAPAPATVFNATGPLHIGACRYNGSLVNNWPGQIDDVRAYIGVLTNTQISALYNEST